MNRLWTMKSMALAGAGFAFTSLALLSVGSGAAAQAQALANHNSSAPVDFAANSIEVQDRADRVVISGNVRVTQAGMTLTAARMTVASSPSPKTTRLFGAARTAEEIFCIRAADGSTRSRSWAR